MTYVSAELRTLVIARAQESCEYCLVHADYAVLVHEIDCTKPLEDSGRKTPSC
jgi:hypothetical protein